MCHDCVAKGRMTAEQLAERIAANDTNVIPVIDMDPEAFLQAAADMVLLAVTLGEPMEDALEMGRAMIAVYELVKDLPPGQRGAALQEALG